MAVVLSSVWFGQPGHQPEALLHIQQGAKIVIPLLGLVAADTVQYGQFFATTCSGSVDSLCNLFGIRHACRYNHGFACAGDIADQRQIDCLKGGDLVSRSI